MTADDLIDGFGSFKAKQPPALVAAPVAEPVIAAVIAPQNPALDMVQ